MTSLLRIKLQYSAIIKRNRLIQNCIFLILLFLFRNEYKNKAKKFDKNSPIKKEVETYVEDENKKLIYLKSIKNIMEEYNV